MIFAWPLAADLLCFELSTICRDITHKYMITTPIITVGWDLLLNFFQILIASSDQLVHREIWCCSEVGTMVWLHSFDIYKGERRCYFWCLYFWARRESEMLTGQKLCLYWPNMRQANQALALVLAAMRNIWSTRQTSFLLPVIFGLRFKNCKSKCQNI